jgi:hypothetical protein
MCQADTNLTKGDRPHPNGGLPISLCETTPNQATAKMAKECRDMGELRDKVARHYGRQVVQFGLSWQMPEETKRKRPPTEAAQKKKPRR